MTDTLEILYKCRCLKEEVRLTVPARRGLSHDVRHWVEEVVGGRISEDHRKRSPLCQSNTMEYVKIPLAPEGGYVGEAGSKGKS